MVSTFDGRARIPHNPWTQWLYRRSCPPTFRGWENDLGMIVSELVEGLGVLTVHSSRYRSPFRLGHRAFSTIQNGRQSRGSSSPRPPKTFWQTFSPRFQLYCSSSTSCAPRPTLSPRSHYGSNCSASVCALSKIG